MVMIRNWLMFRTSKRDSINSQFYNGIHLNSIALLIMIQFRATNYTINCKGSTNSKAYLNEVYCIAALL
jgi:hypothetical protein